MSIRLFLVEDNAEVREAYELLFELTESFTVCGAAADAAEARARLGDARPEVVLVDLALPDMNGLDLTTWIRRQLPAARVVVLSSHDRSEFGGAAERAGASAYVMKHEGPTELIETIRRVMAE